jgi:CubicO group peptidase (beta-lactamase class C family)
LLSVRLTAILFAACLALGSADSARADDLDDLIAAQMQWQRIPGLSVAVVKDGAIVRAKGYGLANIETNTPATAETVYKIGSLSKQFIAGAVLLLSQDAKLGLDEPVSSYLPNTPDAWRSITIRHLLTHTSGLVREIPDFDPFKPQSDAEVIKVVAQLPLNFIPGEKWAYSNVGYYVLAEIITTVSGRPWPEYVSSRIFVPAAMAATRPTTMEIVPHRAGGYSRQRGKLRNADDWPVLRPSGAFLSTVRDLAEWDEALTANLLLEPTSREEMWTPVTLAGGGTHPYGFGWFVDAVNGHPRVRHDGGLPGFASDFERYPEDKLTVILLANRDNLDLGDLANKVAGFYQPALLHAAEPAMPDADPATTRRIRTIIEDFSNNRLTAEPFTAPLGQALVAEMKSGFGETLRSLKDIESFELLEFQRVGDERNYRYRLVYHHVPLFVTCTINPEDEISKFAIHD